MIPTVYLTILSSLLITRVHICRYTIISGFHKVEISIDHLFLCLSQDFNSWLKNNHELVRHQNKQPKLEPKLKDEMLE